MSHIWTPMADMYDAPKDQPCGPCMRRWLLARNGQINVDTPDATHTRVRPTGEREYACDTCAGTIRALTVRQPWASTIALKQPEVRNENYYDDHRGTLLIHAGPRFDSDAVVSLRRAGVNVPLDPPTRAIIAVADLVDVHRGDGRCCAKLGHPQSWHWALRNISAVKEPVACPRGGERLWTPPAEIVMALKEQGAL